MLKCVLLLPTDCVYVRYYNAIISIINKNNSPDSSQGGESSIVWWRNVQGAKRLGGETSRGELTKGRNVQLPVCGQCLYVCVTTTIIMLTK